MSGQWEVVGKKKDRSSKNIGNQKLGTKDLNKKKVENLNVKVEDVLAKSQVKQLYQSEKNKENKPLEKNKVVVDAGNKKIQKKQEKPQELPKAKPPKSIESALNQIDVEEFENIFEKSKTQFPDAPIVWFKELSQYLNQRIAVDVQDPVFTSKPQKFPISVVPTAILNIMEKAVKEANKTNTQLFFDISLTSMATDMGKNLSALGHKLFLQYIALSEPNLIAASLNKHIVLRNSYQNRPNIGLSILWSVGQAGLTDFNIGLTIFQNLMLPLIELKNYSRFVGQYLLDLIKYAEKITLTKEQYLEILETIFSNKKNFPNDLKQELISVIPNLKSGLLLSSSEDVSDELIEFYLRKITTNTNNAYQNSLCDVIVDIFLRSTNSQAAWGKVYSKNVTPSAVLLRYIDSNWKTVGDKLNTRSFKNTLNLIQEVNNELIIKKRKEEGLNDAIDNTKKLWKKMADKKKSKSSFKHLLHVFFFLSAIAITFEYGLRMNGRDPAATRSLITLRVCEFTHKFINGTKEGVWWANDSIKENFPVFHKTIMDFAEPYAELLKNLGRITWNIIGNLKEAAIEKYPAIKQSIDSYAPGFVEQSQNAVYNAWTFSVVHLNKSVDYLTKEVFVGQLSPANMQRVVLEAFNKTQSKASEYYLWLYEKVQTTIK